MEKWHVIFSEFLARPGYEKYALTRVVRIVKFKPPYLYPAQFPLLLLTMVGQTQNSQKKLKSFRNSKIFRLLSGFYQTHIIAFNKALLARITSGTHRV